MPKATSEKLNDAPVIGGVLICDGQPHKLSVTAILALESHFNDEPLFKVTSSNQETRTSKDGQKVFDFQVTEFTCSTPSLLCNWSKSIECCTAYHREGKGRKKCPIQETFAIHEITHFGEVAHSLRHLIRGGNLHFSTGLEAKQKLFKSLQQSNPKITFKNVEEKLENMHQVLMVKDSLDLLILPDESRVTIQESSPFGLEKHSHTDLHFTQVPDDPIEFFKQVLAESEVPIKIRNSKGYELVLEEVKSLLKGYTCDFIVWHRNVPLGNRNVAPEEHQGCELGAKEAFGSKDVKVLHLGDKGSPMYIKGPNLFGLNSESETKVKRTLLQQLQFLSAVVEVSEARMIVAERTGLSDLIALVGGIPMCQFIANEARVGNQRLPQVCDSGCGMGFVVSPWESTKLSKSVDVVKKGVKEGCITSMETHQNLTKELLEIKKLLPEKGDK